MRSVEEGLSLEEEIVSSVSLSPTLGRNEKLEQHIRKKTHKPNVLRFWVEGGVIPCLCGFGLVLILVTSPQFCPLGFSQQVVSYLLGCFSPCETQTHYVLVCVEKCVSNRFEEKRERSFATTSYSNLCRLF